MIFDSTQSVKESYDLDHISMERILELVRQIILYPNNLSNFKQTTFKTTEEKIDYHLTHNKT